MIILLNILFKSSFYIHELSYLQEYILKYRNFILTFLWYSRLHLCLCFSSNYPCCSFVGSRGMFIVLLEYNLGQGEGTDVHMARRLWRTWTTGVWSRRVDRPPAAGYKRRSTHQNSMRGHHLYNRPPSSYMPTIHPSYSSLSLLSP